MRYFCNPPKISITALTDMLNPSGKIAAFRIQRVKVSNKTFLFLKEIVVIKIHILVL